MRDEVIAVFRFSLQKAVGRPFSFVMILKKTML